MIEKNLVKKDGEYYYLNDKDLKNRLSKNKWRDLKLEQAQEFVELVKEIPSIKAVVLTGSSAVGNASKSDDLDFMIITEANKLWLSRLLLTILTKFKNKRVFEQNETAWCLNLWLDENDLAMDEKRQSLYEAYEIMQMQWIFDRGKYEQKFLAANKWLKKELFFYDNFKFGRYTKGMSFSLVNCLLLLSQKLYRYLAHGREDFKLTSTQAFFNSIRFKEKLFSRLEKKINEFDG